MSYVRPYSLQPKDLRQTALESWLRHVFHLIRDNHILSNRQRPPTTPSTPDAVANWDWQAASASGNGSVQARSQWLTAYFDSMVPKSMQEEAFHKGAQMLRKEELYCGILGAAVTCNSCHTRLFINVVTCHRISLTNKNYQKI